MCLEEVAAAEGEQRGGRDATFQPLRKLSSGHEVGHEGGIGAGRYGGVFRTKRLQAHIAWRAPSLFV